MGSGRKKIEMKKIENINSRRVTFTKRRNGLFRKAAELTRITGCRVAALAFSSNVMTPFLYGDLALLEDAAAAFGNSNGLVKFKPLLSCGADLVIGSRSSDCGSVEANGLGRGSSKDLCFVAEPNSNDVKLNPLPGADFGIGGCSGIYESAGCDLGKYLEHGQGSDDKDLCFMEDGFAKLIALGAPNASCGSVVISSSDMMRSNNDLGQFDDKDLCITDDELAKLFGFGAVNAGCCNYERVGDDADGHGEGGDDKKLCFTEDEFAQLMECDSDEEPLAVVAENASCSVDTSTSDTTTMLHRRTKYNDDNALKMIPCSSSSAACEHCCFKDPSDTDCTNTGGKSESDEGLLGFCNVTNGCSEKEKDLDPVLLMKQRMEAFGEAMRDQLRIACEAGDMASDQFHFLY